MEDTSPPRVSKRKLDDAFRVLDQAVAGSSDTVETPPAKKPHLTRARSLYATLAKYGIKSKQPPSNDNSPEAKTETMEGISKTTPHLTAILARAATRTKKALPFKFSSPTSAPMLGTTTEYRPSSITSFLTRLATFKLATYANKPSAIDAVAAAKCGWINDGKDRLVCGLCNASWVVAGREGMSRDAANALVEKQRVSLVDLHKNGCPWKTKQCDASIYRIPLKSPAALVREVKENALLLEPSLENVEIKHPLTATQVNALRAIVTSFTSTATGSNEETSTAPQTKEPSDTAILTSLFGWTQAPLADDPTPRTRATSASRSTLTTPSASRNASRAGTPAPPSASERPPRSFGLRVPSEKLIPKVDTSLLMCSLCQRRIGLWAFVRPAPPPPPPAPPGNAPDTAEQPQENGTSTTTSTTATTQASSPTKPTPQRQLDLLKEHRSYCPYVVRSTVIPSIAPTASQSNVQLSASVSQLNGQDVGGALEGWRAVLTVILRHGMGQRQRLEFRFGNPEVELPDTGEEDGIKAMVTGVKTRGGKDLLKYVKGLLG